MSSNDPDPTTMGTPADFSAARSYGLSGRIMLSAIVILFFVVILMISLHLYARWYILHGRRRYLPRRIRRNRRPTTVLFVDPSAVSTAEARGLDPSVIKSLPVFDFSAATHPDPIECAVCLSEFEDNESGRVLPNCKHTFHVECIDMWFLSHSTCPLCRSLVEPFAGEEITAAEEVVIAIPDDTVVENDPGKSFGLCDSYDSCRLSSYEAGTSTAKVGRLKPAEIEVPKRDPGEFEDERNTNESPSSHSFRSPMSRMLSFTRILNRDRRTLPSPSIGAHSPAPSGSSSSMTESDIERGREENR